MQFKSAKVGGYQIFAITGVNTVSFAINGAGANTKGLLGFAVERHDPKENQKYYMLRATRSFAASFQNPTARPR